MSAEVKLYLAMLKSRFDYGFDFWCWYYCSIVGIAALLSFVVDITVRYYCFVEFFRRYYWKDTQALQLVQGKPK